MAGHQDSKAATAALSHRNPGWLKAELQKLADADRRKLGPYLVLEAHVEAARKQKERKRG